MRAVLTASLLLLSACSTIEHDAHYYASHADPQGQMTQYGPTDGGLPLPTPPTAPVLRSPADGAYVSVTPHLGWSAVPATDHYEIRFYASDCDNITCESIVELGTRGNVTDVRTPPLPVSSVAPVGAILWWNVRACGIAACSAWSSSRSLVVGRARDDFDGDGYSDVAIGAPHETANGQREAGRVYVYFGSPSGLRTQPIELTSAAPQSDARFGTTIAALGDLDHDGFADLAVSDGPGRVAIFFGSASGLSPGPGVSLAFGIEAGSICARDASNELFVGAPGGLGALYSFLVTGRDVSPTGVINAPVVAAGFGASVACEVDLDGDGAADEFIGAPGVDGTGTVYLLAQASSRLNDPDPNGREFGARLFAAGDIDGDGQDDLVVMGATNAYQIHGGPGFTLEALPIAGSWGFGGSDIEADGLDDYIITTATGIEVYSGGAPSAAIAGPAAGFGSWGVLTDVDRDGFADAIVGSPQENRAYVYRGGAQGLSPAPAVLTSPHAESGGSFGSSGA